MIRRLLPLVSILALAACGGGDNGGQTADASAAGTVSDMATDAGTTVQEAAHEAMEEDHENSEPDATAILAALGPEFADADLNNGARQFRRCQSCHTLTEGGRHTVGPNLHRVIGRDAASAEGFSYSRQLSEAGLIWDAQTLDAWIENPRDLVPGNRMSFVGLRDADDRRDVIAHIAVETADD